MFGMSDALNAAGYRNERLMKELPYTNDGATMY
jgi:hypothetical protein